MKITNRGKSNLNFQPPSRIFFASILLSTFYFLLSTSVLAADVIGKFPSANGAKNVSTVWLGELSDKESKSKQVDLDNDDGVATDLRACATSNATFLVKIAKPGATTGIAYLNLWFDWNRDGEWSAGDSCAAEWALQNFPIDLSRQASDIQPYVISFPAGKNIDIWYRASISLEEKMTSENGDVNIQTGEIEDYGPRAIFSVTKGSTRNPIRTPKDYSLSCAPQPIALNHGQSREFTIGPAFVGSEKPVSTGFGSKNDGLSPNGTSIHTAEKDVTKKPKNPNSFGDPANPFVYTSTQVHDIGATVRDSISVTGTYADGHVTEVSCTIFVWHPPAELPGGPVPPTPGPGDEGFVPKEPNPLIEIWKKVKDKVIEVGGSVGGAGSDLLGWIKKTGGKLIGGAQPNIVSLPTPGNLAVPVHDISRSGLEEENGDKIGKIGTTPLVPNTPTLNVFQRVVNAPIDLIHWLFPSTQPVTLSGNNNGGAQAIPLPPEPDKPGKPIKPAEPPQQPAKPPKPSPVTPLAVEGPVIEPYCVAPQGTVPHGSAVSFSIKFSDSNKTDDFVPRGPYAVKIYDDNGKAIVKTDKNKGTADQPALTVSETLTPKHKSNAIESKTFTYYVSYYIGHKVSLAGGQGVFTEKSVECAISVKHDPEEPTTPSGGHSIISSIDQDFRSFAPSLEVPNTPTLKVFQWATKFSPSVNNFLEGIVKATGDQIQNLYRVGVGARDVISGYVSGQPAGGAPRQSDVNAVGFYTPPIYTRIIILPVPENILTLPLPALEGLGGLVNPLNFLSQRLLDFSNSLGLQKVIVAVPVQPDVTKTNPQCLAQITEDANQQNIYRARVACANYPKGECSVITKNHSQTGELISSKTDNNFSGDSTFTASIPAAAVIAEVTVKCGTGASAQTYSAIAHSYRTGATFSPAALSITTTSLAAASVNIAYSQTVSVAGGVKSYTWSVSSGSLPTGLSLAAATGVISGTPTAANTYNFTILATDSDGRTATRSYSVVAYAELTITTTTLADGTNGTAYNETVVAAGGSGSNTFTVSAGALPTGLSLAASTGVISGTPTVTNTFNFTITVTDSLGATDGQALTIIVNAASSPLDITTASPLVGASGVPYSGLIAATGGTTPYSWTVTGRDGNCIAADCRINVNSGLFADDGMVFTQGSVQITVTDADLNTDVVVFTVNHF